MPGLLNPMTPAMTVGGTDLYQQGGRVDPRFPVYKPVMNRSGLLDDKKANSLIKNFAGGLLNGYQYIPPGSGAPDVGDITFSNDVARMHGGGQSGLQITQPGMNGMSLAPGGTAGGWPPGNTPGTQIRPISPSGVYTADAAQGVSTENTGGGSGLTFRDMFNAMYGSQMAKDPSNLSGGAQQQAYLAQMIGREPGFVNNYYGEFDLDSEYDRDNEIWKRLLGHVGASGNTFSGDGGGDGGAH